MSDTRIEVFDRNHLRAGLDVLADVSIVARDGELIPPADGAGR